MKSKLVRIGEVFRYSSQHSLSEPDHGNLRSWVSFAHDGISAKRLLLEMGISVPATIEVDDSPRLPVVLITSNPLKAGSKDTPWRDTFDPNHGHIRYFGDNKTAGVAPECVDGNRNLLKLFDEHSSPKRAVRARASPLIFTRTKRVNGKSKGFREFMGFGAIRAIERVTQINRKTGEAYANYAYDFVVFSMAAENENFDWRWIDDRRNMALSDSETLRNAPESWKRWVREGSAVFDHVKRRTSSSKIVKAEDQRPQYRSRQERTLESVYKHYEGRKNRFEGLAAIVSERFLGGPDRGYERGWVTGRGSDGGVDFFGLLSVGQSSFGAARLIVAGQAKCEKPNKPTNGNHIARTVARLKRGWLGVYVTTSYFSEKVQREIIEDEFPIVLINGLQLANILEELCLELGKNSIDDLLMWADAQYELMISDRRPEELLRE